MKNTIDEDRQNRTVTNWVTIDGIEIGIQENIDTGYIVLLDYEGYTIADDLDDYGSVNRVIGSNGVVVKSTLGDYAIYWDVPEGCVDLADIDYGVDNILDIERVK